LIFEHRLMHIRDICDTSSGGTPSRKISEYFEEPPNGHPWLASRELGRGYVYSAEEHISDEGLANSSAKYFPTDTVLLAMYGATAGKVGRLAVPMTTSQAICGMIAKKDICHQGFLYYLIMAESWKIVWKNALGGAQPNISQLSINTHPVEIPPHSVQEKIHDQLSKLDALIECTEETTRILAEMIQIVFRSWFIDFDPVKAKVEGKLPSGIDEEIAALFPDSFEESDFGPIPNGWELKQLSDIAKIIDCSHAIKPEPIDSGFGVLLHVWNIDDTGGITLHETFEVEEDEFHSWASRMVLSEGDCVVTKTGRVAAVGRIPHNLNRNLAMGRNMIGIRMEDAPGFLYAYLMSPLKEIEVAKWLNSGTVMPSLHVKYAERLSVVVPSNEILTKFEEIIEPLIRLIDYSRASRVSLESCREALLPRLMSGELKVN
jgi:type I restriction enzyme S subunit